MHIRSSRYIISSPEYTDCPKPDRPEFAFIGRSNVGKSSLINLIAGNEKLAKISKNPGKTKLINHFEIESATRPGKEGKIGHSGWYLVDLPGYGFARVSLTERKRWEKMIAGYLRNRENLLQVFVLIDSRHKPQKADLEFVNRLGEWKIPFSLVFTKTDKVNQRESSARIKEFLEAMKKDWEFLPRHFVTSAVKKTGRDKILSWIEDLNHMQDGEEQGA
jgi:GTP-binding protein